jgi:effector-binding domain-containing protein
MTLKSVLRFLGIMLIGLGIWYFFIKGYNYQVSFTTKQSPSIVYDHLTNWNDGKSQSDSVVSLISKQPFTGIVQNYKFGDSLFKFDWDLKMLDESTTKVTAKVKDEQHSAMQNLYILSPDNHFKNKSISTVQKFGESLVKNAENYRLHDVKDSIIPSQNCAYISVKSKRSEKASAMLKNIFYVMNYIKEHDTIQLTGHPFLEVTEWNTENDSLKFDFCFPINKMENYPKLPSNVSIKKTKERKALKTIFNGNYRISDRAWLQLRDYAAYNNIKTHNLPVEIFHNDPHTGTNSLEWKAEIFMPLSE